MSENLVCKSCGAPIAKKTKTCEYCGADNPDYSPPKHRAVSHPRYEAPIVAEPAPEAEAPVLSVYQDADLFQKIWILTVLAIAVITSLISLIPSLLLGCFILAGGSGIAGGCTILAILLSCPMSISYSFYYFIPGQPKLLAPSIWILLQIGELFLLMHNLPEGSLHKY